MRKNTFFERKSKEVIKILTGVEGVFLKNGFNTGKDLGDLMRLFGLPYFRLVWENPKIDGARFFGTRQTMEIFVNFLMNYETRKLPFHRSCRCNSTVRFIFKELKRCVHAEQCMKLIDFTVSNER